MPDIRPRIQEHEEGTVMKRSVNEDERKPTIGKRGR